MPCSWDSRVTIIIPNNNKYLLIMPLMACPFISVFYVTLEPH